MRFSGRVKCSGAVRAFAVFWPVLNSKPAESLFRIVYFYLSAVLSFGLYDNGLFLGRWNRPSLV